MFGKRMENPAMSHPLVSLGPGAGYRTHIVAEPSATNNSEALTELRVVSEIAASRLSNDDQRRRPLPSSQDHDASLSEGDEHHDERESKRDGDSTRRLGRSRRSRTQEPQSDQFNVIRRWRPRGRLARWLGFVDHEDAVATPPGTSIPNALARYRVSLLQMRRRAERIRSTWHAETSRSSTRSSKHSSTRLGGKELSIPAEFPTPSLFTEILPHDGFTRTRATQSHAAAARSASSISNPSDEPCLFTHDARTGGRFGREQSHRARAREVARREGGPDTGAE